MFAPSALKDAGSGVYAITNSNNGKRYIGSAVSIYARARLHLHALRRGKHHSVKLQRSFDKHGEAAFTLRPILICAPANNVMYEQRAIDGFDAVKDGYNILPTAGSPLGVKRTDEQKARLSASHKLFVGGKFRFGHSPPAETRAKMSASQKLRAQKIVFTPELRERLRQQAIGNKSRTGYVNTPETRARMSAAHLRRIADGVGHEFKPGHIISAETRAKMSIAHRGLPHSAETRAKIAAANRARAAEKAGAL